MSQPSDKRGELIKRLRYLAKETPYAQGPNLIDAMIEAADALESSRSAEAPINQCDGCRAGMPLDGHIHTQNGFAYMACTKDRYAPSHVDAPLLADVLRLLESGTADGVSEMASAEKRHEWYERMKPVRERVRAAIAVSSERAPDMDELRAKYKAATPEERQRLIHDHDCPRAWEFYHRWSAGSKVCPSCLLCGHQAFDRENWAITHAELPDIYICKGCVDKARAAPSSTDAPFINEHRKILKGYMDSKAAHQTIDWLCDMAIAAPSARKQQA